MQEFQEDTPRLDRQQTRQIDYLLRTALEAHRQEDEWLSQLRQAGVVLLSIAAPLALAGDISGSPKACISAALLFALLGVLSASIRLRGTVRAGRRTLQKVLQDTLAHDYLRSVSSPISSNERRCGRIAEALFLLSALSLLAALCCSLFS